MQPSAGEGCERTRPTRGLGLLLLVAGIIGLVAASTLLVEKIELISNPEYVPSCSINPVLSCGSVMMTPQAEAFGIPNPMIGVGGFAALAAIGALVASGSRPHRGIWVAVQVAVTFGVVFVHWLIWQSLYAIGALCPYCMVVWVVTIAAFVWVTSHTLRAMLPERAGEVVHQLRPLVLTTWHLAIIILITERFWDYWVTLF